MTGMRPCGLPGPPEPMAATPGSGESGASNMLLKRALAALAPDTGCSAVLQHEHHGLWQETRHAAPCIRISATSRQPASGCSARASCRFRRKSITPSSAVLFQAGHSIIGIIRVRDIKDTCAGHGTHIPAAAGSCNTEALSIFNRSRRHLCSRSFFHGREPTRKAS